MVREMTSGERELWNEAQRDAAPDVRTLWHRYPVARRAHRCDLCGGEIAAGTQYETQGYLEDGALRRFKSHQFAYYEPSGCPAPSTGEPTPSDGSQDEPRMATPGETPSNES